MDLNCFPLCRRNERSKSPDQTPSYMRLTLSASKQKNEKCVQIIPLQINILTSKWTYASHLFLSIQKCEFFTHSFRRKKARRQHFMKKIKHLSPQKQKRILQKKAKAETRRRCGVHASCHAYTHTQTLW